MAQRNDNPQSIKFGERALELIKCHNLSANPSSYAVWYAYVAGSNPALARSIDGIVASKDNLSDKDVDEVRQRHLPDLDAATRLTVVGERLGDEVEQIIGMIEASMAFTVARSGT